MAACPALDRLVENARREPAVADLGLGL